MRWLGRELVTKEDWADAMIRLQGQGEANRFRALAALEYGRESGAVLGYLTGDIRPEHRSRVQALLGIRHPFEEVPRDQLWLTGAVIGKQVAFEEDHPEVAPGLPPWVYIIYRMPRANWNLHFEEEQP